MTSDNAALGDGPARSVPATAAELAAVLAPEQLLADYAAALHRRTDRIREDTAGRYLRHVERWLDYAAARRVDPLAPPVEAVELYASRATVADRRGRPARRRPSPEITRQRLTALTGFYDHLRGLGLVATNPARALARPQPEPRAGEDVRRLTPAEVAAILDAARGDGPYAHAVFRALADLGVRAVEVQRATVGGYRPGADGGPVLHTQGRHGVHTARLLPRATVEALDDVLEWRRVTAPRTPLAGPRHPLFAAPRGHRHGTPAALDSHRFATLFRRVLRASGVARPDQVTSHAFRHAWVRHGVACGWAVTDVQAEIGHRRLSSTLRYLVGGTPELHPLAVTVRPLSLFVAEAVVMLRAVCGGEALPVTDELAARRRNAEAAHRELDLLRELHATRRAEALALAEVEDMRARIAALGLDVTDPVRPDLRLAE